MKDYRITRGERGWVTERRGKPMGPDTKTPGAETWREQRYHSTLEQAAESMLDRLVRDRVSDEPGFDELLAAIRAATAEVKAVVAEAGQ